MLHLPSEPVLHLCAEPFQEGVIVICEPGVASPQIFAPVFCWRTMPSLQRFDNASFACAARHIDSIRMIVVSRFISVRIMCIRLSL